MTPMAPVMSVRVKRMKQGIRGASAVPADITGGPRSHLPLLNLVHALVQRLAKRGVRGKQGY
jgi:hypothetical protein